MVHTACPESTRNLPNSDLDAGDVHVSVQALGNFGGVGTSKKQLERFDEIGFRLFDAVSLAGHVDFWAERHETGAFALTLTHPLPLSQLSAVHVFPSPHSVTLYPQPLLAPQLSVVQKFPSPQSKTLPPLHLPALQPSLTVHKLPSSHAAALAVLVQPLAKSQGCGSVATTTYLFM